MSESDVLSWFLNHLWQSTLFAALAAGLVRFFRSNDAAVRYNIWLVASLKFLVPFSIVAVLGQWMDWRPLPNSSPMTPISTASAPIPKQRRPPPCRSQRVRCDSAAAVAGRAGSGAGDRADLFGSRNPDREASGRALARGRSVSCLSWFRQWLFIRARLRIATPLELDVPARIPAVGSTTSIEPAFFGIFRPVLLLPIGSLRS
jgi:hypothetical protein